MNKIFVCAMMSVAVVLLSTSKTDAAYCGLAKYQHGSTKVSLVSFSKARKNCSRCETCETSFADPSCCGPKLVKDVVYEKKQYTCYKTVCEKVVEQKKINCIRY